jgi:hypothetical protein
MIIELKLCSSRPSLVYVQLCTHGHDTGEYLRVGELKIIYLPYFSSENIYTVLRYEYEHKKIINFPTMLYSRKDDTNITANGVDLYSLKSAFFFLVEI